MARTVEIERHSGFCGGVIRAIGTAEAYLDAHPGGRLHSLGAIVHNEAELERLAAKGLVTIRHEDIPALSAAGAGTGAMRKGATGRLSRVEEPKRQDDDKPKGESFPGN